MSSSKSNNNGINIEDLIDDEATVEDFEEYNQIYPDVDAVTKLKNHCTSCFKHIGLSLAAVPKIRLHNVLKVTICKDCDEFYNSGEFEKGEDGSELFCRWCGQGGVVLCCTKCIFVFCKECIKRNLGTSAYKKIANDNKWSCFRCNSNQLLDLRARHHVFTNYLLNRQNYVNETARNRTELKALLLEDMSTCCRSNRLPEPEPSTSKAETTTTKPVATTPPATAAPEKQAGEKRPRQFVPGTAPGPLSKKLKALRNTPDPKKVAHIASKSQATSVNGQGVNPKSSLNRKSNSPPEKNRKDSETDEPDLFSLLNPIIEMQVQGNDPADDVDPLDPLATSEPHPSPSPERSPTVTANQTWRPIPVNTQTNNHLPQWNQPQMNQAPMTGGHQMNTPDMDSFGFGGHFMAMASNEFPQMISPPIPQQPTYMPRMAGGGVPIQRFPINRPPPMNMLPQRPVAVTPRRPLTKDSVFHVVNGYRIDLKAASERQVVTLPDGKVIHVRRHTTASTPDAMAQATSVAQTPPSQFVHQLPPTVLSTAMPHQTIYTQNPNSLISRPRLPIPPAVRLSMPPQLRVTVQPRPVVPREAVLPAPQAAVPVRAVGPRPRRKTTLKVRSEAAKNVGTQAVQIGRIRLNELMMKMSGMIEYTTQRCNTFKNSKLFKNARTAADVAELHTNFGYIMNYTQQRLADIDQLNQTYMSALVDNMSKEKPSTADELQVVENRPTCINLDSDEEVGSVEDNREASETNKPPSLIRCKTVSEINTTAAGKSSTLTIPKKKKTVSPKVQPRPHRPEMSVSVIIDSSDEEDGDANKKTAAEEDQSIIKDILNDVIDSLFGGGGSESKENDSPNVVDTVLPKLPEEKDDTQEKAIKDIEDEITVESSTKDVAAVDDIPEETRECEKEIVNSNELMKEDEIPEIPSISDNIQNLSSEEHPDPLKQVEENIVSIPEKKSVDELKEMEVENVDDRQIDVPMPEIRSDGKLAAQQKTLAAATVDPPEIITLDDSMEDSSDDRGSPKQISTTKNQTEEPANNPEEEEEQQQDESAAEFVQVENQQSNDGGATSNTHQEFDVEEGPELDPFADITDVLSGYKADEGEINGIEPMDDTTASDVVAGETGTDSTANGAHESMQTEERDPPKSKVCATEDDDRAKVGVVVEQSIDDVFSALETISKEIQRKEDSENGIDSGN